MIDFKNLIVGTHESKVLFTWNRGKDVAMLGTFLGIEDGVEAILARDEITPIQRAILKEFRAIAGQNDWNFAALRESIGERRRARPRAIMPARSGAKGLSKRKGPAERNRLKERQ